jgi:lysosomal-associated membrane protein 1/2
MEWLKTNAVIAVFCLLVIGAQGQGAEESVDKKTTTTTAATTTTTAATTPTTPATTTTTTTPTAKPTTPPKPTPFPHNRGDWTTECVKVQGAMEIAYNGSTTPIPPSSVASSDCSDLAQTLTLSWPAGGVDVTTNTLTLHFLGNRNKTEMDGIPPMKYGIVKIDGVVNIGNETIKVNLSNVTLFHVGFNHSYKCDAQEVIKDDREVEPAFLKTADWQVEAFRIATGGKKEFGEASDCTLDGVTDVVPIAVGACLAGLVVIVLIAYLFGRRRSRARGYQSV